MPIVIGSRCGTKPRRLKAGTNGRPGSRTSSPAARPSKLSIVSRSAIGPFSWQSAVNEPSSMRASALPSPAGRMSSPTGASLQLADRQPHTKVVAHPSPAKPHPRHRSMARLPQRLRRERSPSQVPRECAAHRAWVSRHHCSVPGCMQLPIECAHVHTDTDGGMGLKLSDRWTISLCRKHHMEQHRINECRFERQYGIDMRQIAQEFARRSPHSAKLRSSTIPKTGPNSKQGISSESRAKRF